MRLSDSAYERSYFRKKNRVLLESHPLLSRAMGAKAFQRMLEDYLDRHPTESFRASDLSSNLYLFLRQSSCWREIPIFSELARLELYKIRARATSARHKNEAFPREQHEVRCRAGVELISSFYNLLRIRSGKAHYRKQRHPHYYAVYVRDKRVRVLELNNPEHRILHWILRGTSMEALTRRAARFRIGEKKFFAIYFKMRRLGLVEHFVTRN